VHNFQVDSIFHPTFATIMACLQWRLRASTVDQGADGQWQACPGRLFCLTIERLATPPFRILTGFDIANLLRGAQTYLLNVDIAP
jgi:hypothetical protein